MTLDVTAETVGETVVLSPDGRLDTNTAKEFDERVSEVLAEPPERLVVDMQGVDYVSSFGLRVILSTAKRMTATGGELVVCGLQPDVHTVFRVSGFLKVIKIADDRQSALAVS